MARTLAYSVIIINTGACVCYAIAGDYRRAVYWGAAAILNLSVTI